jgi:hypothetical protein
VKNKNKQLLKTMPLQWMSFFFNELAATFVTSMVAATLDGGDGGEKKRFVVTFFFESPNFIFFCPNSFTKPVRIIALVRVQK